MGWFDNQIKLRKKKDSEGYAYTLLKIAGAVSGNKKAIERMEDENRNSNAIEEIASYYGIKHKDIPEKLKSLEERLDYVLHPEGILKREVELKKGWRKDAFGVMIGFLKGREPVALLPDGIQGYKYFDPERNGYIKVCKREESLFEKRAYLFYRPFPLKALKITDLVRYIVSVIRVSDYVMIAVTSLLITLSGVLLPRINYFLFDKVIEEKSSSLLLSTGVFMICVYTGSILFNAAKSLVSARIDTRMSVSVEAATMMRILSLPAGFFKNYSSGELSSRASYVNNLCSTLVNVIVNSGLTSVFSLVYISQIFVYAPGLVIPALTMIIATVIFSVLSAFYQMKISKRQMLISTKENGMSYALISAIQKIRLAGAEKRAFTRWGNLYADLAEISYNPPLFIKVNSVISLTISIVGTVVMYHTAIRTGVNAAEYYAFNTAYAMVSGAFLSLAGTALTAANIRPVFEMAEPILKTVPEISGEKEIITSISGGVEINNLSFRYDENSPVILNDISLKIRPGQYVAIVGKTGCGKSTLVRLLLGFEKAMKGGIYFDGKDINSIDLKSLRKNIGVVTQNGRLFAGDIYSNIVVAAPHLTVKDAWEAAAVAGIDEDIRNMPMEMNTLISEGGGGISGGQKQRIMIARAVAPKPKLLIFDEATSALDNITQKKVSDALDKMNCTRIVIAHRLSTIRNCEMILVMDEGRIVESGNYDELMKEGGFFCELVKRQQLSEQAG